MPKRKLARRPPDASKCAICFDRLDQQDGQPAKVQRLVCDHAFHEACISRWLQHRVTCPLCRKKVCLDLPLENSANSGMSSDSDDSETYYAFPFYVARLVHRTLHETLHDESTNPLPPPALEPPPPGTDRASQTERQNSRVSLVVTPDARHQTPRIHPRESDANSNPAESERPTPFSSLPSIDAWQLQQNPRVSLYYDPVLTAQVRRQARNSVTDYHPVEGGQRPSPYEGPYRRLRSRTSQSVDTPVPSSSDTSSD